MSGSLPQPWTARPLTLVAALGILVTVVLGVAAHLAPDPGMSPLSLTISDYAVSSNGWPMNVAILALGLSSLAVPLALRAVRVSVGVGAEALLLVWSLGLTAAAVVPTDPIGVVELSTRGHVHRYVSVAAFVALPVGVLLAIRRLATDARWQHAVRRLRVLAVASVLALLGLYYVAFPGGRLLMGLVERILVVVELALLAVLVRHLHRVAGGTRRSSRRPGTAPTATPPVRRPGRAEQGAWGTVAGRAEPCRGDAARTPPNLPPVRGEQGRRAARW